MWYLIMYDRFLHLDGAKVTLRALTEDHTSLIVRWRNNPEVSRNLYTQTEITESSHLRYFHAQVATGCCAQFVIYINESMKPIGSVFLKNIDTQSHKAEYGIFIGEDEARGRGYGSEAARLIIQYGFHLLNLNRIYLSVFSENHAAISSYEKVGFHQEGQLRQDFCRNGKYYDVVLMAMLAAEDGCYDK